MISREIKIKHGQTAVLSSAYLSVTDEISPPELIVNQGDTPAFTADFGDFVTGDIESIVFPTVPYYFEDEYLDKFYDTSVPGAFTVRIEDPTNYVMAYNDAKLLINADDIIKIRTYADCVAYDPSASDGLNYTVVYRYENENAVPGVVPTVVVPQEQKEQDEPNDLMIRLTQGIPVKLSDLRKQYTNDYNDYNEQVLLPHKMSQFGPAIAVGDINADGREDVYVGQSTGKVSSIFIQNAQGMFVMHQSFNEDFFYEDLDAQFFDFDNDGDLDLYVASGGNEFEADSPNYEDRLYENRSGKFVKRADLLPDDLHISSSRISIEDYNKDGYPDLFVGGRHVPHDYPSPASSYILKNNKELQKVKKGTKEFTRAYEDEKSRMSIQRFKGLGEMNPEELWNTTLDPETRNLLQVQYSKDIKKDQDLIHTLMGNDVALRKDFIVSNAINVQNLDI